MRKLNHNELEYSDISGHYAEKYINELAYYGVGFEGGEFKPDEKITQKDFLGSCLKVFEREHQPKKWKNQHRKSHFFPFEIC